MISGGDRQPRPAARACRYQPGPAVEPFQRPSRCLKSHGKGGTSYIWSTCHSEGLQSSSKTMTRAEQAKSTVFAISKAFKVSQKPRQGQNKLNPQHLPFQRPSRRLKSHRKGRTVRAKNRSDELIFHSARFASKRRQPCGSHRRNRLREFLLACLSASTSTWW